MQGNKLLQKGVVDLSPITRHSHFLNGSNEQMMLMIVLVSALESAMFVKPQCLFDKLMYTTKIDNADDCLDLALMALCL